MLVDHADDLQQQLAKKDATLKKLEEKAAKWEKAFVNADKQYLKMEHNSAELRRENERLRKANDMLIQSIDQALADGPMLGVETAEQFRAQLYDVLPFTTDPKGEE